MTQKELDQLQEKALAQLKSGESLFGKDGAFAPMLKGLLMCLQSEAHARFGGITKPGRGISQIELRKMKIGKPKYPQSLPVKIISEIL